MLPQESLLQNVLDVASAVEYTMDEDGGGFEGIDDTVGFVVEFPELCHANLEEFRRNVATEG